MIENGLRLTPRELYCLGGILNARYIDKKKRSRRWCQKEY